MTASKRRVLVIGLDGFELSLAEEMMNAGELPALQELQAHSARFLLEHGDAKRTGLAWEHVSAGLSDGDGGRETAVYFDKRSYATWSQGTVTTPFVFCRSVPNKWSEHVRLELRREVSVSTH